MILRSVVGVTTLAGVLAIASVQAAPPPKGGERNAQPNKPKGASNSPEEHKPKAEPQKSAANGPHNNSAPGGKWSEPSHSSGKEPAHPEAAKPKPSQTGTNPFKNPNPLPGEKEDAAAVSNRNNSSKSGAEGAAAGAAISNRNSPKATGAEGAAAGAAAVNRNAPKTTGADGAAAGATIAKRNEPQVTGAEGAAVGAAAVRDKYSHPNLYTQEWYAAHPGAWAPNNQVTANSWNAASWEAIARHCGTSTTPVVYNYGTNVTYENGNITAAGRNLGTAAEFSQQAALLAQTGAAAQTGDSEDWMPLGVFAMVCNEQEHPHLILQLAVNKQGLLRGNYTDELTEQTQPVQGSVDVKTQRAAWTIGDAKTTVLEAGLSNLSSPEAPVLIHRRGSTDHRLLVRLNN